MGGSVPEGKKKGRLLFEQVAISATAFAGIPSFANSAFSSDTAETFVWGKCDRAVRIGGDGGGHSARRHAEREHACCGCGWEGRAGVKRCHADRRRVTGYRAEAATPPP